VLTGYVAVAGPGIGAVAAQINLMGTVLWVNETAIAKRRSAASGTFSLDLPPINSVNCSETLME
jgi:hypothetical protein